MAEILLRSIRNARDLGGIVLKDGRKIKPYCLLRSAHLGQAEETDTEILKNQYRLSVILDLRTGQERAERPDQSGGIPVVPCPILPDRQEGITHEKGRSEPPVPDMARLYRKMMTGEPEIEGFRRVLEAIFSHDYTRGAVLWHCTEGKDRCGMTTALVLEALGADREQILADYLLTNKVNIPRAQAVYERLVPERGEVFARSVY